LGRSQIPKEAVEKEEQVEEGVEEVV